MSARILFTLLSVAILSVPLSPIASTASMENGALASCGDPTGDGRVSVADALYISQASTQTRSCDVCSCAVTGGPSVTVSDALEVLRAAVGLPATLDCPACTSAVCGDDRLAPFTGTSLGTEVTLGECLFLAVAPDDLDTFYQATVLKALDANLNPVTDVEVRLGSTGCECGFFGPSSSTTTTMGECNCLVDLVAHSASELLLVEVFVALDDGDCNEFIGSGTLLVDAGIEEECDDGNVVDGDGCSATCRLETD